MGPRTEDAGERFESVYRRCWTPVFRLALAWTNDWGAAEDLAQEAFARLWTRRDGIDWDEELLPWLLVVTRRLATDRFRRLRTAILPRAPRAVVLDAEAQARWIDVRASFSTLSPMERAGIAMTAVSGYSYEEAAELLGTTAGGLRAAVSRGRTKLRQTP